MHDVQPDSAPTCALLQQLRQGDTQALDLLLVRHRSDLLDFIELHLDPRVRARVDPSDVVQETHLEVLRRLSDYLEREPMPFRLWLRKTAYDRVRNVRRDHRQTRRRSVDREVGLPDRSSVLLAQPLLARGASPSQRLAAREQAERVSRAVQRLSELDREILLMRHVEDLSYAEVGQLLEIEPSAARKRYGRALLRLRMVLAKDGLLESES